jgi:S-adenosylmethionine:tRNA ribosyltransferase-isomerase
MLVSEFHYELPQELIAQRPPAVRGSSRMLTLDHGTGAVGDRTFAELPSLLRAGDLLVLNDSRVMLARLYATRVGLTAQRGSPAPTGQVEVLLTQRLVGGENAWSALVKPAKKVSVGERLLFGEGLRAEVVAAGEFGERTLRFDAVEDFHGTLERIGHLPLPPYIRRGKEEPDRAEDRERYQTVYSQALASAEALGSAAAPTAGLHFTPEILEELKRRQVEVATLSLHVGLGTFQPVRVERTEEIRLHAESYTISAATAEAVNKATGEGRRIVAAGTTSTRTLEHIAREAERTGTPIAAHSGSTSLFLSPGAEFKLVGGLLTNFHLPESTLLMLVSAFAGREHVLAAYAHAVAERYRFFSYGDCMLIL